MIIHGLDTETIDGYCRIISDEENSLEVNSFDEIYSALYKKHYFTYNLRYDMEGILKYLPEDFLKDFVEKGKNKIEYKEYNIFYIPNKLFSINKKGFSPISIYDFTQFCNFLSLNEAAKLYGLKPKQDNVQIRNFKGHQKDWNLNEYINRINIIQPRSTKQIIKDYCRHDANLVFQIAQKQAKFLKDLFDIELKRPTSKAKIGVEIFKKTGINYPSHLGQKDKPSYQYAQKAYKGGIFYTQHKGTFQNLDDYDIQSAYPYSMIDLPNWLNGSIIYIDNEIELEKYEYGWIYVNHNCPYFPVKRIHKNQSINIINEKKIRITYPNNYDVIYPEGYRYDFITLFEYNFLKKWKYDVKFLDGFVWKQKRNMYAKPFGFVKELFEKRLKYPKKEYPIENSLIKIGMNGFYGKTAQKKGNGEYQNFYYASYITAKTRCAVIEFILDNQLQDDIIQIATDGILLKHQTKELKGNFNNELGAWEKKEYKEGLILGNGVYQLDDETKFRGFHTKVNLKTLLQHKRFEKEVIVNSVKVVHLTEAIRHKKIYNKEDINKFIINGKLINCQSDTKMKWAEIENFGNLLDNQYKGERLKMGDLNQPEDINESEKS